MFWIILLASVGSIILLDLTLRGVIIWFALPIVEHKMSGPEDTFIPDPLAEPITIPTSDGLVLQGSLYQHDTQPACGLLLFCPEMGANHWSAMTYAQGAWNAGFDILSFDFRGQGESPAFADYDPLHWVTEYEITDVSAAMDYIKSREDLSKLPLAMMGISRGGGTALLAAAKNPEVCGVMVEGAFSNFELMRQFAYTWARLRLPEFLVRSVPQWHIAVTIMLLSKLIQVRRKCTFPKFDKLFTQLQSRPVLLVTGSRDKQVNSDVAKGISDSIGGSQCSIWKVTGAKHNKARQIDPLEYDRIVGQFFLELVPASETTASPELVPSTKR